MSIRTATAICSAEGAPELRALCLALPDGEAPAEFEIVPKPDASGKVQGIDGRWYTVQSFDEVVALHAKVGNKIPIDINHSTEIKAQNGDESPAQGWIGRLFVRAGALWAGAVEWRDAGRAAVESKAYRYVSPAFVYLKKNRQIERITSVGLVTQPNFTDLPALNSDGTNGEPTMKKLLELLGLAVTATEDEAIVAVNAIKTDKDAAVALATEAEAKAVSANAARSTPDLALFVPRADFELATNRADAAEKKNTDKIKADRDAEIETAINAAIKDGKVAPSSKEFYVTACNAEGGLEQFKAHMETAPEIIAEADRGTDGAPPAAKASALSAVEQQVCETYGLTEDEYRATEI